MLSFPLIWGEFFPKKLFTGRTFLDKFMRGKFKSCTLVCWWRRGELVWPGDKPAEKFCQGTLGVEGNYLWCLVIVVIFMWLRGAKRFRGGGGFKIIIWGTAGYKGRTNIYGEGLITLDTIVLSNYYYVFNTILTRKIHHNILNFVNTI